MRLTDKLENHFRINELQKKALDKLGLVNIKDMLYFFPTRYSDISNIQHINTLIEGESVTILGKITDLKTQKGFKSKVPMGKATVTDITGKINIYGFISHISQRC
jgi:ATP-dependent DNA helicase RecG